MAAGIAQGCALLALLCASAQQRTVAPPPSGGAEARRSAEGATFPFAREGSGSSELE
jgi:hypothetical protein